VGRDLHCGLKARLLDDNGGERGGGVGFLWVVGDLRTLLFAGGQGLTNSTFSHMGGLPDLFIEHNVGALQGQENQNLLRITIYGKAKPITISFAVNNIV
jgi:hypothetical protein